MKKIAIILTIVATTAMIFSSCGKYDEGPGISLLTKKARITGTWEWKEQIVNNNTIPQSLDYSIEITFEKDGSGKMALLSSGFSVSTPLEWEFNDSKETLKTRQKDGDEWEEWENTKILRLTNSELWTEDSKVEDGVTVVTITKFEKK